MPKRKKPATPLELGVTGVKLRSVTARDLDAVADIWLNGWLSTDIKLATPPTLSILRARIASEIDGGWHVVIAEMSDGVAGFVAMSPHDRQLEQIFVAPAFHRRGVGAALLAHARTVMPEGFTLWTHGDNHGAARFYDAVGMELLGPAVHPRHGYPILTYAVAAVPQ